LEELKTKMAAWHSNGNFTRLDVHNETGLADSMEQRTSSEFE
jgi:hypothetical protein